MSTNIYANHRENQKEWILEVAEDLFIQKGIELVTIGDIAKASRLTRATIYKYFANKEQIAQEIFRSVTKGWRDRNEREVWGFQGTGYELLEKFITVFFSYLFQNPREASFAAELNYLYAKQWSAEMFANTMLENLQEDRQFVLDSIRKGVEDGSLRSDIDPELMLAAFFNFISGTFSRLGEMGDKVEKEFGHSSRAIFTQICRIFLDGLKAPLSNRKKSLKKLVIVSGKVL
jgi:AcrR family transcriptional regulator